MVELESEVEEEPLLENARGHLRVADRPQKNCVFGSQKIDSALGNYLACREVAFATPVERFDGELEALHGGNGRKHFDRLCGNFRPGAVSGDRGDLQGAACHRDGHLLACLGWVKTGVYRPKRRPPEPALPPACGHLAEPGSMAAGATPSWLRGPPRLQGP